MTPVELSRTVLRAVRRAVDEGELRVAVPERVLVTVPGPGGCGDYATNIALQLARPAGQTPQRVAEILRPHLVGADGVADVVVTGPGFINFSLRGAAPTALVEDILRSGSRYGFTDGPSGQVVQLHCPHEVRAVVVMDAVARLLRSQGALVRTSCEARPDPEWQHVLGVTVDTHGRPGAPAPLDGNGGPGTPASSFDVPAPLDGNGGPGTPASSFDVPAPLDGNGGPGTPASSFDVPAPLDVSRRPSPPAPLDVSRRPSPPAPLDVSRRPSRPTPHDISLRPVPAPTNPLPLARDAARWALLHPAPHDRPRITDEHLVQRESNPLFRVRYAHARTRALSRNAADLGFSAVPGPVSTPPAAPLVATLADHPRILAASAAHHAPDRLARHLVTVADAALAFLPAVLPRGAEKPSAAHRARLALAEAAGAVLAGGLSLLGIDAPEHI